MPVVSQSIIRPIVPVGASTLACELRTPNVLAELDGFVPRLLRGAEQLGGTSSSSILAASARCMRSTLEHVLGVLGVAGERTHACRRCGPTWRRRDRSSAR